MTLGLCTNPSWLPDRPALAELRPPFLRSILYRLSDLDRILACGPPVLITLNNECAEVGGDWRGWDAAVAAVAERAGGRLLGVEVGNEFDIWGTPSPEFAADLTRRAASILKPRGVPIIGPSVASATWPHWLARYTEAAGDAFDYACLHPYGQRPNGWGRPGWMFGDLAGALRSASAIAGRPVACTEYGVKLDDAGGEDGAASFLVAAELTIRGLGPGVVGPVAWFANRDEVGTPHERGGQAFGLLSDAGRKRPAWHAYAGLPKGDVMPDDGSVWPGSPADGARFVLGFAEWADAEPELIGRPHDQTEWGAAIGQSQQRTTHGLLTWSDLKTGQVMTFLDGRTGRRYRWMGGSSHEVV